MHEQVNEYFDFTGFESIPKRGGFSVRTREQLTPEQVAALPDIITTAQAAAIVGVCDPTMIRWAKEGYVSARRVGRSWRYNKQSVVDIAGTR